MLESVLHDIGYAMRTLGRSLGFTVAAVLTLALGIGATTAMFSTVYGVLLRPLPYVDSGRLVRLSEWHPGGTTLIPDDSSLSNITYHAWNGRSRTIGPIAAYDSGSFTVGLDEPARMPGGWLEPTVFTVLGVSPAVGRFFNENDARLGAARVVVLSYALWRERFAADPAAVGRTLTVDEQPHVIVGIARPNFAFPDREARLWVPTSVALPGRVMMSDAIARLQSGATASQAADEGTAIARAQTRPPFLDAVLGKGGPVEVKVQTLVDDMTDGVRPALLFFLVGVGCLLLIACANVANLLLSRGVSRWREVAVRAALGAGRARLIRQLLTESVVMASMGGALGVVAALAIVRTIPAIAPQDFPRLDAIGLDWNAVLFAFVVSLLAGVIAGVVPAFKGARPDLLTALREGAGVSVGWRTATARRLLLAAEASLAVVLLVVAVLVARSFLTLLKVDPGYDAANVLTARVYLPGAMRGQAQNETFIPALLERIRAVPGVAAAGAGGMAPFGVSTMATPLTISLAGREPVTTRSRVYVVTPGYAEALRLRLRAGRQLSNADMSAAAQSIVVNDEFVRTFLGGREPVGVNVGVILTRGVNAEIVGVVGNVLKDGLNTAPVPEVFIVPAHRYAIRGEVYLVLRTATDPAAVAEPVRRIVHELRREAAVENVSTLASQVSASVANERLATTTVTEFASVALILAGIGLYGVLSYGVSARTREIGVRAALGASRRRIVALVVRDGMTAAGVGLVVGLVVAAGVARLMERLLFGIEPLDPVSFLLALLLLGAVGVVACALPAIRAARIDPAQALRSD